MSTLTTRQRMTRALHCQEVDHVPSPPCPGLDEKLPGALRQAQRASPRQPELVEGSLSGAGSVDC